MALHSKKDFCKLCGIKTKDLSIYIKRGKVVLQGDYVDEFQPANAAFLQKNAEKVKNVIIVPEIIIERPSVPIETETKKDKPPSIDKSNLTQYALEKEIKLADLQKKEVDTRIALLKEEKLMGVSIPTELVKGVISSLSKSIISSFKDGADNFLIEIAKRKSLTGSEIAECRGILIKIINTSSTRAISESKKSINSIVNEFSDKRDVGEHD